MGQGLPQSALSNSHGPAAQPSAVSPTGQRVAMLGRAKGLRPVEEQNLVILWTSPVSSKMVPGAAASPRGQAVGVVAPHPAQAYANRQGDNKQG
jgi:hypothetical protein